MPGTTLDVWGPAGWRVLHVFAHTAPAELDAAARADMAAFLRLFATHLPCPRCRRHFADFLDRRMTDEALATRDALVVLLHDAHNEVNRRTGKRVWTLAEHRRAYARPSPRDATGEVVGVLTVVSLAAAAVAVCAWRRRRGGSNLKCR